MYGPVTRLWQSMASVYYSTPFLCLGEWAFHHKGMSPTHSVSSILIGREFWGDSMKGVHGMPDSPPVAIAPQNSLLLITPSSTHSPSVTEVALPGLRYDLSPSEF